MWGVYGLEHSVHIVPLNDWIDHKMSGDECCCEPDVEWVDPESLMPYGRPIITHHAIDGRSED